MTDVIKVAGYYLYFTSHCVIECMHVQALSEFWVQLINKAGKNLPYLLVYIFSFLGICAIIVISKKRGAHK